MKYLFISNNTVLEIIPEKSADFPSIPIEDRYSAHFLSQCDIVPDDTVVETGYIKTENGYEEPPFVEPTPPEPEDLEVQKANKQAALSAACQQAITQGCEVQLSDGEAGHISLTSEDQINLISAAETVRDGAAGYPYHLDGALCRIYGAQDIAILVEAATRHKLYHTTYCNHVLVWARRCETVEELSAITYGAQLPPDLAENMAQVLGNVG